MSIVIDNNIKAGTLIKESNNSLEKNELSSSPSVFSIYKKNNKKNNNKSRASIGSAFSNLLFNDKTTNYRYSTSILNTENKDSIYSFKRKDIINEQDEYDQPLYLLEQMNESTHSNVCLEESMDEFAKKYFATHKTGLFKKKVSLDQLVCWTNTSISQPLILSNKYFKEALKCFKTIQYLMNDRQRPKQFQWIEHYQYLLDCGISKTSMRDEIYIQICKQLNQNPKDSSIKLGWELLCIVCVTFPPSKNLESYLYRFVEQHHHIKKNQVDVYSQYISSKLNLICNKGAKGKVLTLAEIEHAKEAPFKPSIFGESLEHVMNYEHDLKIPKIIPFLTHAVHDLNGKTTEGIFRVPGDADAVTELRIKIENGQYDSTGIDDPNVPASLLKYWLRDLTEPLIPTVLYQDCIYAENKEKIMSILNSLPELNRRIIFYIIRFLQDFTKSQVIQYTLMNVVNLAMVFAPNFLRCPSTDLTTLFENSKREQDFIKTLLIHLELEEDIEVYSHNEQIHGFQFKQ